LIPPSRGAVPAAGDAVDGVEAANGLALLVTGDTDATARTRVRTGGMALLARADACAGAPIAGTTVFIAVALVPGVRATRGVMRLCPDLAVWAALSLCGAAPPRPLSAWATPDPLASAAPTPNVIAPAPSHRYG
jgi:hypothetical protein